MTDQAYHAALRWLALTAWLTYAALSAGSLSIDPETRFRVAESIARNGTVALAEPNLHTVEHDGKHYSLFFPGQTLVLLPVAAAEVLAADGFGIDANLAATGARFATAVFVMPAFALLYLLGHVALLRALEVGRRLALFSGGLLLIGTHALIWGTNGSEETILGAISAWAFWALVSADRIARDDPDASAATVRAYVRHLGLAGVLLAIGMIHRSTFIAVAGGAAVLAIPSMLGHRRLLIRGWGRFAVWVAAGVVVVATVPLYNWIRFGNALDTGYGRYYEAFGGVFSTDLLTGLRGHLLSPGKSVFLYVPWLVLLPPALLMPGVRRRLGRLGVALLVMIALHLLIYSKFIFWAGAFGWSVRFHVSIMPLLFVPIAVWLDRATLKRGVRVALVLLATASVLIQLAGRALNDGLEHRQHPEYYTGPDNLIPDEAAWTWHGSQLTLRLVNIGRKLSGRRLLDLEEGDPQRIVTVWSIFPCRAAVVMKSRVIVIALWALWILLVAAALGAGGRTVSLAWPRAP
ncbi:MAG: hypothetical protein GY715_14060 [Planctomycetes bacterium]|nr:hypothetical protein [Planctomycetota bacterium]